MDATLKKTSLKRENKIDWSRSLGCGVIQAESPFCSSLRKIKEGSAHIVTLQLFQFNHLALGFPCK